MKKETGMTRGRKWLVIVATLLLCIGLGAAQAFAAAPYVPIFTTNNNLSITDATNTTASGGNDIWFIWDGTLKTSVAVSGQVSNATLASYGAGCFTGTGGTKWVAHDVAVYGPGTYTVFASCAAKAPGCAGGTSPITFTVGASEIGVHMLVDWGTVSTNKNIDVVDVWQQNAVFGPSPMWTGACGSGNASQIWDLMSKPNPATPTINGYAMVDGPFIGTRWNFNLMGPVFNRVVDTGSNNFTMIDGTGNTFGGTNDVRFTWDGTQLTSVATSGQVSNASLSSGCLFFAHTWAAHDVAVYAPGTYTIFDGCAAGSPGCGVGNPVTFTVNTGELGAHMLFFWNGNDNIDVVDVWQPNLPFLPSVMCDNTTAGFVFGCGTNALSTVWDHMSYDWNADGINGAPMSDGPFLGSYANFNVMGNPIATLCTPPAAGVCDDNNVCTDDGFDGTLPGPGVCPCTHVNNTLPCSDNNACTVGDTCSGGSCVPGTALSCNDNNMCTTDTCDPATGCVFTPIVCNDNNMCTTDTCDPASGCVFTPTVPASCNDNNACTTDGCTANACTHTVVVCNDNNACTTDTCDPATGCVFTPIVPCGACTGQPDGTPCNDNNACTMNDACSGQVCVGTSITCNDNNICTTDTCDPASGCVFTPTVPASCDDNDICTIDGCTANACTHTATVPASCNDNNACTTDGCTANACTHTAVVCNDNNVCTTDTCDPATGCVFTPIVPCGACAGQPDGTPCNDNNACTMNDACSGQVCVGTPITCNDNDICTTDSCDPASGCVFTPTVPASCNDNDACTTDGCTVNACTHTAVVCNDNNVCTTDTCVPATGCVFTPIVPCGVCAGQPDGTPCNDNNACTMNDACSGQVCAGTPITCNDNDICTTDSCDPASGCVFTPTVPASCDDNNACTIDGCTANACTHTAVVCNDNDICTTDTCDPATGCVYTPIPGCVPTGSDVGIVVFRVPSDVKDCMKAVPIQILIRNFGATTVTGTITLNKDGVPVQTWSNVKFNKQAIVSKLYLYNPAGDVGKTITWTVVVDVPNDPNLSNNTSVATTTVVPCGTN